MFTKIKELLFGKSANAPEAPYKVETPAPVVTVDGHGDVHEVAPVKAKAKKAPAKKPAATAKAPAKPRTPKTPAAK